MPPRSIPRSYALDAVLELLALPSNSTFYRSGLGAIIAHYPPGVYDALDVYVAECRTENAARLVMTALNAYMRRLEDADRAESRG